MSKIMKLKNGKEIDLDFLYPNKESVFHKEDYSKKDDIYNKYLSKDDIEKYNVV